MTTNELIDFIKPKKRTKVANTANVNLLIKAFNKAIRKDKFILNDGLDQLPPLTESDFILARRKAQSNGYTLTKFEDNYQTTSYKLVLNGK